MSVTGTFSLRSSARAATLWRVLTSPGEWRAALPDIAEADIRPPPPLDVGSQITTARTEPGRTPRRFTFTVVEFMLERRLVLEGRGRAHRSIVGYALEEDEDGTTVHVLVSIDGSNILARWVIALFAGAYRRQLEPLAQMRTRALVARAEHVEAAEHAAVAGMRSETQAGANLDRPS
jgi:hypothetical protein